MNLLFLDIDNCDPEYNSFDEGIGLTPNGLCGFHGRCVDFVGFYKCECFEGWRGGNCDIGMLNINFPLLHTTS